MARVDRRRAPRLALDRAASAGVVDLPPACRDRPDEIVFLLRHGDPASPSLFGTFVAYGAGRAIR